MKKLNEIYSMEFLDPQNVQQIQIFITLPLYMDMWIHGEG